MGQCMLSSAAFLFEAIPRLKIAAVEFGLIRIYLYGAIRPRDNQIGPQRVNDLMAVHLRQNAGAFRSRGQREVHRWTEFRGVRLPDHVGDSSLRYLGLKKVSRRIGPVADGYFQIAAVIQKLLGFNFGERTRSRNAG